MLSETHLEECYHAIFHRKSVRKFKAETLDPGEIDALREFLSSAVALRPEIKTELRVVPPEDVKPLVPTKARHFILASSEPGEGYLENIGFLLQQADLYLSSRGLGGCWLGMSKPTRPVSILNFVIVLAFGRADEPVHRDNASQFKRKAAAEVASIAGMEKISGMVEALRLAPSSTNSQPWYFTGSPGQIHVWRAKLNPIKAAVYDKMNRIDMGIALCHLWLSERQAGAQVVFGSVTDPPAAPKGYQYVTTCTIKQ